MCSIRKLHIPKRKTVAVLCWADFCHYPAAIFNSVKSSHIFVQKRHFFVAFAVCFALLLVLSSSGSNSSFSEAQMPSNMVPPTTQPTNAPTSYETVLLVIVASVLIAILLILAYFRKRQTPHVYKSTGTPAATQTQRAATEEAAKPFEVFLCYKKSSGKDYADHLKTGLEEVGLHTFEDCKDIPLTVTTEEGWAKVRDQALTESKYFVLVMTPGFDLSSEVVKELAMARKQPDKAFVFFRHRSMGRRIVVDLGGGEVLDITQLEQVSFESKEELLRLAINILKKS